MAIDPCRIVEERTAILDRMTADFSRREGALGLFIRGSLADGSADSWSDIDATVVVAPEYYPQFTNERLSAPSKWGELLYNSGTMDLFLCISHFRPFVKLDLFYLHPEDLAPSPWCARPVCVVFDRDGSIRRTVEHSVQLRFTPAPVELNQSVNQAISYAHEVVRKAERGELAYARQILGKLRQFVVDADATLFGAPPVGFSHFESRCRTASVLEAVRSSFPSAHEKNAILSCLKELVRVYRQQIAELNEEFTLGRDLSRDGECLDIVEKWNLIAG